jgi:hypothetical protein
MIGRVDGEKYVELSPDDFTIDSGETFVVMLSDDTLNPKIVY